MTDQQDTCPGPHQGCQGCNGQGMVNVLRHYVGKALNAPSKETWGLSTCTHCKGKGAFCQNENRCDGR